MLKFLILTVLFHFANCLSDSFDEKLTLTTRGNSHLQAEFRFWSTRNYTGKDDMEYTLFPRIIQETVDTYSINYLIITMGLGRWKNKWGAPPTPVSTAGAQLYVELEADNEQHADEKLKFLVEALNGILCTSISKIQAFTSPELPIFQKSLEKNKNPKVFSRYGIVSDQPTCTENLTRLRKLLACREMGLSALLHPSRMYGVPFHSSHVVVENRGSNNNLQTTSMEIGISVVMKLTNKKRPVWMVTDVFDRDFPKKCPAASTSQIEMITGGETITYNLEDNAENPDFEVKIESGELSPAQNLTTNENLAKIWSSQGGSDQYYGDLLVSIQSEQAADLNVVMSQIIPHHVQIRYSSITKKCYKNEHPIAPKFLDTKFISKNDKSDSSALLQIELTVEPGVLCEVNIPFIKNLLKLDQYPPDANHGFHIPAAVIFARTKDGEKLRSQTILSNAILVNNPVPDFSMPFNVICFVATVYSLVFGPIQLYSTMYLAPVIQKPGKKRYVTQAILLSLIIFCLYAHFMEINLNEIRRGVANYFEKLNEMK